MDLYPLLESPGWHSWRPQWDLFLCLLLPRVHPVRLFVHLCAIHEFAFRTHWRAELVFLTAQDWTTNLIFMLIDLVVLGHRWRRCQTFSLESWSDCTSAHQQGTEAVSSTISKTRRWLAWAIRSPNQEVSVPKPNAGGNFFFPTFGWYIANDADLWHFLHQCETN